MGRFPSPIERTVASALLLLSTTPPSQSHSFFPPQFGFEEDYLKCERKRKSCRESLMLSDPSGVSLKDESLSISVSCSSSLTSEGSSEQIRKRRMKIITVMTRFHEMKFNVVRKSRSKIHYSSGCRKISTAKAATMSSESVSTEASCLSSISSAISSARSRIQRNRFVIRGEKRLATVREQLRRRKQVGSGSAHMRRRAEAILKFLSGGCSSEVKIRQVLGDSPDTSKALRMLLKLEEVKRYGTGGRHDPYIYTVA